MMYYPVYISGVLYIADKDRTRVDYWNAPFFNCLHKPARAAFFFSAQPCARARVGVAFSQRVNCELIDGQDQQFTRKERASGVKHARCYSSLLVSLWNRFRNDAQQLRMKRESCRARARHSWNIRGGTSPRSNFSLRLPRGFSALFFFSLHAQTHTANTHTLFIRPVQCAYSYISVFLLYYYSNEKNWIVIRSRTRTN